MKDVHRFRQKMRRHDLRVEREEWERAGWKSKKDVLKGCPVISKLVVLLVLKITTGSVRLFPSHLWAVVCVEQYLKKRESMEDVTLLVLVLCGSIRCASVHNKNMRTRAHTHKHTHTHTHTAQSMGRPSVTIASRHFSPLPFQRTSFTADTA